MLTKNNSRKLSLAIGFLAMTALPTLSKEITYTPAACPDMKNSEQAIKTFMESDLLGARLQTSSLDILSECFETDDTNAWDHVRIIENMAVNECKKASSSCVRVKFSLLGELYSGDKIQIRENPKIVEIELSATKSNEIWKISGLDAMPPMVSPKALLEYLQSRQQNDSSEWIGKSIEHLKPLGKK